MTKFILLRKATGLSKTEFSKKYNIPYRTVQNWENGTSTPPDYVLELLKYRIEKETD